MTGRDINPRPLSPEEVAFVDEHGGVSGDAGTMPLRAQDVLGVVAGDPVATVAQAAASLNLPADEVRRRLREGALYARPDVGPDEEPQLPLWQFRAGQVVPHLAQVLANLPEDFTYAEVRAFALNARIDDPSGEATASLLDWLAAGGDPGPAVDLAAAQALVI